jgi:hypothetical protein
MGFDNTFGIFIFFSETDLIIKKIIKKNNKKK